MRSAVDPRTGALVLFLVVALSLFATEHPGFVRKEDNCSSCHISKIQGKSVHSAMALSCTVCHQTQTQGDMTSVNLPIPRARICFACHEESAMAQRHSRPAQGVCLDCHDVHSSNRRLLLLNNVREENKGK